MEFNLDFLKKAGEALSTFGKKDKEEDNRFDSEVDDQTTEKDTTEIMHIDFEGGENFEATGAEIYEIIFNSGQPWIISANGTIFTYEKKGIIPGLLERWYAERKILQKNAWLLK